MNEAPAFHAIFYHKQSTSAMTRFLRLPEQGILSGAGLAADARLLPHGTVREQIVLDHPTRLCAQAAEWLGLESSALCHEHAFRCALESNGEVQPLHLLRFTTIDPPFAAAERVNGAFITITQARNVPPLQLEMLRLAYSFIMEG